MFWACIYCMFHIVSQFFFCIYNFHCSTSQNVAWTYQNRVTNFSGNLMLLLLKTSASFWLRNSQFLKCFFEFISVFSSVRSSKKFLKSVLREKLIYLQG
jgi:hypothetical protein